MTASFWTRAALVPALAAALAAGGIARAQQEPQIQLVAPEPASPQVPLVEPAAPSAPAGDAAVSQWQVPPGNTGLEPLPDPGAPAIARNGGVGATQPGATRPPTFEINAPLLIAQVMTYHYGAGRQPGTIALQHADGTTYGPWPAAGAIGQGGVPNAYWWAQPNVVVKPGRYTVLDSDPATWSVEASTQGAGIFVVWGRPAD
jgi:hypothetical protein